jgi:hypothetical protein
VRGFQLRLGALERSVEAFEFGCTFVAGDHTTRDSTVVRSDQLECGSACDSRRDAETFEERIGPMPYHRTAPSVV